MRIELPNHFERFGANHFYAIQRVYELDGGLEVDEAFTNPFHVIQQIPHERLHEIERDMAIVVPVRNERLRLLEGVLSGIPHACLPIVLSNSEQMPTNRFGMEQNLLESFCRYAKKRYVIAHQRDPELARLFVGTALENLLDDTGLIRHGKAEGMILASVLAKLAGKKYIGFVDSDNYFPGAVFEYIRLFSAGLSLAKSPFSMVRIQWHSKPKIVNSDLFFAKWGRVTRITNQYLNRLVSLHTGFESEVLRTGNAGEHAMSMELALALGYSSGFSVETNHFISMIEKFGGVLPCQHPLALQRGVDVFQMESRNPHLHDANKGDEHIREMIEGSLSVIYHSKVCPPQLKKEILAELRRLKILKAGQEPELPRQYAPLELLNFEKMVDSVSWDKLGNYQYSAEARIPQ
ncbi:MAG: mannosyl-3-phosphoglycerate synthase [Saprospiraceae bacterium]|nr:mannosyl-3-phosphoglycerate synthase [Saprospiraceae bacterium]